MLWQVDVDLLDTSSLHVWSMNICVESWVVKAGGREEGCADGARPKMEARESLTAAPKFLGFVWALKRRKSCPNFFN
jgi:hypothetical protein